MNLAPSSIFTYRLANDLWVIFCPFYKWQFQRVNNYMFIVMDLDYKPRIINKILVHVRLNSKQDCFFLTQHDKLASRLEIRPKYSICLYLFFSLPFLFIFLSCSRSFFYFFLFLLFFYSLSFSLSLYHSFILCLSLALSFSLSFSLIISFSFSLSLSLSFFLAFFLSFLSPFLSLSHSHFIYVYCLFLSPFFQYLFIILTNTCIGMRPM